MMLMRIQEVSLTHPQALSSPPASLTSTVLQDNGKPWSGEGGYMNRSSSFMRRLSMILLRASIMASDSVGAGVIAVFPSMTGILRFQGPSRPAFTGLALRVGGWVPCAEAGGHCTLAPTPPFKVDDREGGSSWQSAVGWE